MKDKKRTGSISRKVGNILAIPLGEDWFGFAWVLNSPLVAFFDLRARANAFPSVEEIAQCPIAFRIAVMKAALTSGEWPLVGNVAVPEQVNEPSWFFKQDPLNGKIFRTMTGEEEIPATAAEVEGLECAAVWSALHVEQRLREHFAGQPSTFVESMKVKPPEHFEALRARNRKES